MDYDVIVIGSGVGGLTTASRLSILGYKVGVFEQHFIPGGYATNFKRKGYNFDVSLHGIGGLQNGGSLYNILKHCQVLDKITPIKNQHAYSYNLDNNLVDVPNDKTEYINLLIDMFPSEEKEIKNLFDAIERFDNGFNKFILHKDNSVLSKLNKDVLLFINWSTKTTYEVISKYVKNEEFIRVFTTIWTYYGLPPKELSSLYFFIPWISYHKHGKFYIKGGAQELSNAFVKVIKSYGGDIKLRTNVEKIVYEKNKVCGIQDSNGEIYKCRWIVSNINPIDTYQMLPKESFNKRESKIILNSKIGITLSQLYLGLDCNPRDIGIDKEEIFFLKGKSHEEDYNLALNNKYDKSGFLLTNYNEIDKSLNEYNKGVLTMTYIDNYNYWPKYKEIYRKQKEEVTKIMIDTLETYYKGISNHIVIKELGTPKTMERYTKNKMGAVYGYSQYVNQAGKYRLKKESSVSCLSFVGAWVNPGGGYEGAISG